MFRRATSGAAEKRQADRMTPDWPVPPPLDAPEEERSLERYYLVGLVCMLFLILAFPLYRLGEPERRERAAAALYEQNVALGEGLFVRHCASCHGDAGQSDALSARVGSSAYLTEVSDSRLTWLTAGGVPGTAMPSFHMELGGPLGDHEIRWIVTYLRSLASPPAEPAPLAEPAYPEEPVPTPPAAATALRPDSLAVEAAWRLHCGVCHGSTGQGGALGPALRPPPAHLRADPDSAFVLIARGIPGVMIPYLDREGGPLDEAYVRALVDWFLAYNEG